MWPGRNVSSQCRLSGRFRVFCTKWLGGSYCSIRVRCAEVLTKSSRSPRDTGVLRTRATAGGLPCSDSTLCCRGMRRRQTSSRWHHERAPHLSNLLNPQPTHPPTRGGFPPHKVNRSVHTEIQYQPAYPLHLHGTLPTHHTAQTAGGPPACPQVFVAFGNATKSGRLKKQLDLYSSARNETEPLEVFSITRHVVEFLADILIAGESEFFLGTCGCGLLPGSALRREGAGWTRPSAAHPRGSTPGAVGWASIRPQPRKNFCASVANKGRQQQQIIPPPTCGASGKGLH